MNFSEDKLIFVAGVPRSGTTLVQNILDCHPNILGGPEFDRICNIVDLRRKLNFSIESDRIDFYLTKKEVDLNIAELIKKLLFPAAKRHNCSFISEKTPWNILAFQDLIEILPKAKFIHIIRNPFAVIASMQNVARRAKAKGIIPPDFTQNTALACYYIESVLKLLDMLNELYPNKVYTIKYENLIDRPKSEIKKLCDYIGVDFDKRMLKPGKISHPGQKTMTRHGVWYSESMYNNNFDKNNLNKWESELNNKTKAFISFVFLNNPIINEYEYSFSNEAIPKEFKDEAILKYKKYRDSFDFTKIPFRTL